MSAVLQQGIMSSYTAYDTYQALVRHGDFGVVTSVYDCDGYPEEACRLLFVYGLPIHSDQELIELLAVYDAGETAGEKR